MKYLVLLFFSTVFIFGRAQNNGYFGKKNLLSLNAVLSCPIIYNFISNTDTEKNQYINRNGKLEQGNDLLDYGISGSYIRNVTNNFGFGIDFSAMNTNCRGPKKGFYTNAFQNDVIHFDHEIVGIRTINIGPAIEFTTYNSILPLGIHGQFSVGYSNSRLSDKSNLVELDNLQFNSNVTEINQENVYDRNLKFHGIFLMLGLNVRTPINKSLALNYGVKYNFNHTFGTSGNTANPLYDVTNSQVNSGDYYVSAREMLTLVSASRRLHFATFNIGLNYIF